MNLAKRFNKRKRELIIGIGTKLLRILEKIIARYSLVGDPTFFDPSLFPWAEKLEAGWKDIREELDAVLEHREELPNFQDISKDQYAITKDDLWKTYLFFAYGVKAENNCRRCPKTTRLIENIPNMKTAFFSILAPGKHIQEHRGPYKGVIRYHLGLKIPEPRKQCRIRVGKDIGYWEEGKSLIFDDSFRHEAWNETDGVRVVLFIDFVRPVKFPFSLINRIAIWLIAMSPFIQDVKANQLRWDKRLETLFHKSSQDNKAEVID